MNATADGGTRLAVDAARLLALVALVALVATPGQVRGVAQEVYECHPDYVSPCVPIGPETVPPCDRVPDFAFPVGEDDPLGLDPDHDGLGCEAIQETIWGDDLCEVAYCH
ncbi:MAG: hypothetical protein ACKOWF_01670 [Chloroflexota bacterium]